MAATIWFWSDPHFHHANIIQYSSRPFADIQEMEDKLVTLHNSVVKPQDHSYCLGDFSILRAKREWPEIIRVGKRLNGHKRIILGNHDHCPTNVYTQAGFEKIRGSWGGIDGLMLSHIPVHPRSVGFRFRANVHGHIHENGPFDPVVSIDKDTQRVTVKPYINVSMEAIGYTPISLEDINATITRIKNSYEHIFV